MTYDIATLLVAGLATWQIVEVWHHSSLMATWRARTQLWENKLGELLGCPFCLSVWVGLLAATVGLLPLPAADGVLAGLCLLLLGAAKLVVLGFAVARLANLGNDLTHKWCRTPRDTPDAEQEPERPVQVNLTVTHLNPKTTFEKDIKTDGQRPDPGDPDAPPDVR